MKNIFIFMAMLISLPVFAYNNHGLNNSLSLRDIEDNQRAIQRKQNCILRNQREQQRYTDCLSRCRMLNMELVFAENLFSTVVRSCRN